MVRKLSAITLYPFILCLLSSTHFYFNNYNLFPLHDVFRPLFISLCIIGILFFIFKKFFKDTVLAGLYVFFLWAWLTTSLTLALLPLILIVLHLCFNLKKEITFFLNIIFIALGMFTLINIAIIEYGLLKEVPPQQNVFSKAPIIHHGKTQPSIIHILLDGYSSFDSVKKYMGYDNQAFKTELEAHNFKVLDTQVPYNRTLYSMASMFSGDYIKKEALLNLGNNQAFERMLANTVTNGNITNALLKLGYHLYFSPSGYIYQYPKGKSLLLKSLKHNLYEYTLTVHWSQLLNYLLFYPYTYFNQFVENAFALNFNELPIQTPAYMYLHILSPHPPFNVDENGLFSDQYEANNGFLLDGDKRHLGTKQGQLMYRNGYLAKLKYTNKAVIKLIKNIQANVKGPKIILVHGDHGSKMMYFEKSYQDSCFDESFSSFLAVYSDVPGIKSALSKQKPFNTVNTYRGIFSVLFQQSHPFLQIKRFFVPKLKTINATPYQQIHLPELSNKCLSWQARQQQSKKYSMLT